MANRAAGKGYENENFYDNIKFKFFGIENIHVMRASLSKLIECKYLFYSHTAPRISPKFDISRTTSFGIFSCEFYEVMMDY